MIDALAADFALRARPPPSISLSRRAYFSQQPPSSHFHHRAYYYRGARLRHADATMSREMRDNVAPVLRMALA